VNTTSTEALLLILQDELRAGRSAVLVSVLAFRGSVPRKDHPRALFLADGRQLGTVGGGCVDGAARALALRALSEGGRLHDALELDSEDADASGLVCGGALEFEAERLEPGAAGGARVAALLADPSLRAPRLYLLGGGHVGLAIARFADAAGWRVRVHDDRPEYAAEARFPFAEVRLTGPLAALAGWPPPALADAVVIATRGHHLDLAALRWAVTQPAGYLGLLGSARKRALLEATLRQEGAPAAALARLHCPIGLAIGALSAEEIALAAVAELIAYRRGALAPAGATAERKE
jgi:xanthine dehydrogenase accessory factor